jgi:hypothetical protein
MSERIKPPSDAYKLWVASGGVRKVEQPQIHRPGQRAKKAPGADVRGKPTFQMLAEELADDPRLKTVFEQQPERQRDFEQCVESALGQNVSLAQAKTMAIRCVFVPIFFDAICHQEEARTFLEANPTVWQDLAARAGALFDQGARLNDVIQVLHGDILAIQQQAQNQATHLPQFDLVRLDEKNHDALREKTQLYVDDVLNALPTIRSLFQEIQRSSGIDLLNILVSHLAERELRPRVCAWKEGRANRLVIDREMKKETRRLLERFIKKESP